ncbi:MAG: phage terminase small subunit P27 family [Actinomycetota bacterium]
MGRRGPAKKSARTKRLQGTTRKDRAPKRARAKKGTLARPGFLGDEAAEEWDRIVPELEQRGHTTPLDRAVLATYCFWFGMWSRLVRVVEDHYEEHGSYTMEVGEKGYRQEIPEVSLTKKAGEKMIEAAKQIGLTPAARGESPQPPAPEDDARDFLFRRAA